MKVALLVAVSLKRVMLSNGVDMVFAVTGYSERVKVWLHKTVRLITVTVAH